MRKIIASILILAFVLCIITQSPFDFSSYEDWCLALTFMWSMLVASVVFFYAEKLNG